jgi:hypothetical protein
MARAMDAACASARYAVAISAPHSTLIEPCTAWFWIGVTWAGSLTRHALEFDLVEGLQASSTACACETSIVPIHIGVACSACAIAQRLAPPICVNANKPPSKNVDIAAASAEKLRLCHNAPSRESAANSK